MLDDTRWAVPALDVPVDGLAVLVRQAVRGAIEAAVESELSTALGRAASATGYRHGTITRTLVTSAGPVALTVPRGRVQHVDGSTQEWRSEVLPRYRRRTAALDTTLARRYLSGASTRDLRRALAPLFGTTALSKSAVSRVVTRVHGEYQTWQQRSLADEAIAYRYLDGQRHRVRADGHATWCSVLMALGVRTNGEKVVLALRVVGGEQAASRRRSSGTSPTLAVDHTKRSPTGDSRRARSPGGLVALGWPAVGGSEKGGPTGAAFLLRGIASTRGGGAEGCSI